MKSISSSTPKALINLQGKSLLERSLQSLPIQSGDEVVFIHRLEGFEIESARKTILENIGPAGATLQELKLNRLTLGQAETAYLARDIISNEQIAIYNTDTYFNCPRLLQTLNEHDFDGVAPCYRALGDHWSFFGTRGDGPYFQATEVREKVRISPWCSTGFYYFKKAEDFFNSVATALKADGPGELYVAPLYSRLIEHGKDIRVVDCAEFKPMGTPEQINSYWGYQVDELIRENNL